MTDMPKPHTLELALDGGRLDLWFNRPDQRNAINAEMADELAEVVAWLAQADHVRVVVLRGAGGHFCAGGDIKERRDMAEDAPVDGRDPIHLRNRDAGLALRAFEHLPQTTIAAVEGSAFGGGMGYACLTDITIVCRGARMGMPETTLGIAPAQIAPYVVKRIGLTRARQLALTGERFDGEKAHAYGIAQYLCEDDALEATVDSVVAQVLKCGPRANAETKRIMLRVGTMPDTELIDCAARDFAALCRADEGLEGQQAFRERRKPFWQK